MPTAPRRSDYFAMAMPLMCELIVSVVVAALAAVNGGANTVTADEPGLLT